MKSRTLLPIILMVLFALTRWPGLMPPNFSAVYAMMFCAGVFFPRRLVWWLPLCTMLVTDLALNIYWHNHSGSPMFSPELIGNYVAYVVLLWLGRQFDSKASFLSLLGGGLLGAVLFYFITNTLSWLFNPFNNPEYTRNFAGWLIALTKGTSGWPTTLDFFRHNLTSGGLFTALFAGAMKMMEAREPAEEEAPEESEEPEKQPEPEEAKA